MDRCLVAHLAGAAGTVGILRGRPHLTLGEDLGPVDTVVVVVAGWTTGGGGGVDDGERAGGGGGGDRAAAAVPWTGWTLQGPAIDLTVL